MAGWQDMPLYGGRESFQGSYEVLSELSSIRDAKNQLNEGTIPSDAKIFMVFSKSAGAWYLLYREGEPHTAADIEQRIQTSGGGYNVAPQKSGGGYSVAPQKSVAPSRSTDQLSEGGDIIIKIKHLQLNRIFSTVGKSQDLYVTMLWFEDAASQEMTEIWRTTVKCGCETEAQWEDETIGIHARDGTLTLEVFARKMFWADAFCGECFIDVGKTREQLSTSVACVEETLALLKNGEETGKLQISAGSTQTPSKVRQGEVFACRICYEPSEGAAECQKCAEKRSAPKAPKVPKVDLEQLLKSPEALDKKLQDIFSKIAKPEGEGKVLMMEDLDDVHRDLSEIAGGSANLDELVDLFWRYSVNETATLGEREAMSFFRGVIMRYRDAIRPKVQRKLKISEQQVEDDYVCGKKLGSGAFGVVYIATQKRTNREVVLKSHARSNPQMPVEEINKEFQMMTTLRHAKVAHYYEIFQDSSHVYIVSEPYYGGDLGGLIPKASQAGIQITENWLARLVKQIAQGVSYLHSNGIIHCDLKEENVMVANEDNLNMAQVVVIDFGLAGTFNADKQGGGTPGYMPPEVWTKHLWTPRGDVFSLGCVIFSMVTADNPFRAGAQTMEDVEELTLSSQPSLDWGSLEIREMTNSVLLKDLTKRPTMDGVLRCPWILRFGTDEDVDDQGVAAVVLEQLAHRTHQTRLRKVLLMEVASRENLAQNTELNKLFMKMDKDNDGRLSVIEIREALTRFKWAQEDIKKFLDCLLETDDDGAEVSYEEFMVNLMGTTGGEDALLERIFREADKTERGHLDLTDIENLLKRDRVKEAVGSRDAASVFNCMDKDGDGLLSLQEFKAAMYGMPPNLAATTRSQRPRPQIDTIFLTHRPRKSLGISYVKDQAIELYSTTHQKWLPGNVVEVDPAKGVRVNLKLEYWFKEKELKDRVRPAMEVIQED